LRAHAQDQRWKVYRLYVDDGYSTGSRNLPALERQLFKAALNRSESAMNDRGP
jgi:hypothetical protein